MYQDIFVLATLNFEKNGYFVEFGASDGVALTNTNLLEKKFGWNDILSEPAKCWHQELTNNRNATICFLSGIQFRENKSGQFSKILKSRNEYTVSTVSLNDLLERYDAPKEIDYLSIDTEGTEFVIIKKFDFKKYKIAVITIEDNENRDEIFSLLSSYGYRRVHEDLSLGIVGMFRGRLSRWYLIIIDFRLFDLPISARHPLVQ